jgi:quinol monooxygenase YgiN
MMIEEYAGAAALASHADSEHMRALRAVLGAVLASPPDFRQYNVSSVQTPAT